MTNQELATIILERMDKLEQVLTERIDKLYRITPDDATLSARLDSIEGYTANLQNEILDLADTLVRIEQTLTEPESDSEQTDP